MEKKERARRKRGRVGAPREGYGKENEEVKLAAPPSPSISAGTGR